MKVQAWAWAVVGWVLAVLLVGFLTGPWPAAVAAVAAVASLAGWVGSRHFGWAATVLVAAAPVAWLVANWPRLGSISPDLVTQAPWPSRLVAMALVLGTAALATRRTSDPETDPRSIDD